VHLDGRVSYLESSPLLDHLGVRLHSALRVLLCVECRIGFPPKAMVGHLKKHGIPVSQEEGEDLEKFADIHNVERKPWEGPIPSNYGPPVELIRDDLRGYACGIGGFQYGFREVQTSITDFSVGFR
jgi:hypothetical protein